MHFDKAEKILGKLLKLSWKLKNVEAELKAYELLGLNYYYK